MMNLKLRMKVGGLLAVVLMAGMGASHAAEKSAKTSKTPAAAAPSQPVQPQPPQQAQPAAPPVNRITQAIAQLGVQKCLGRVNQFTSFLTANSQNGAILFTSPVEVDRRLLSISLEIQAQNALTYATATFAPGEAANECGGMYEAVTYWNNSCNDVGSKAFGAFKRTNPLRQDIAALEGGPNLRVFLMPSGQGCISVKKEIVY
jgi:hypothetical protein